jgi:hypothetical protein
MLAATGSESKKQGTTTFRNGVVPTDGHFSNLNANVNPWLLLL